ncbi:unnamed protein product [Brassica oleracea]|uniref:(rape) hypothetical protein n=1 Tax=Brassica napus TaxID=3708 RepID=A0A816R8M3_BRANA|nr:unnamed protein product [Brassica napus]
MAKMENPCDPCLWFSTSYYHLCGPTFGCLLPKSFLWS